MLSCRQNTLGTLKRRFRKPSRHLPLRANCRSFKSVANLFLGAKLLACTSSLSTFNPCSRGQQSMTRGAGGSLHLTGQRTFTPNFLPAYPGALGLLFLRIIRLTPREASRYVLVSLVSSARRHPPTVVSAFQVSETTQKGDCDAKTLLQMNKRPESDTKRSHNYDLAA